MKACLSLSLTFTYYRIAFLLSTENEGNLHFQCLSDVDTSPKSKDSTSVQDFSKEDSCKVAVIERLTKNNGLETALECDSWLENLQGSQERHLREMFTHMSSLPEETDHEHDVDWENYSQKSVLTTQDRVPKGSCSFHTLDKRWKHKLSLMKMQRTFKEEKNLISAMIVVNSSLTIQYLFYSILIQYKERNLIPAVNVGNLLATELI